MRSAVPLFCLSAIFWQAVQAHEFLSWPVPRKYDVTYYSDQIKCETSSTTIDAKNTFVAGSYMVPRHGRTNHAGGFNMYTLNKLEANPSTSTLLAKSSILHIDCHTSNCQTNDIGVNGGQYVGDQTSLDNSCWGSGFYWPDTPGDYVLFWYHYGSHGSNGVQYEQLPVYGNCANIRLTGGSSSSNSTSKYQCTFAGGDQSQLDGKTTPSNQCQYKTWVDPPMSYAPVAAQIKYDQGDGKSALPQHKGVGWGVPTAVSDGTCKIISNKPKIGAVNSGPVGPWDGNSNKMPSAPSGGFKYQGGGGYSGTSTSSTTSSASTTEAATGSTSDTSGSTGVSSTDASTGSSADTTSSGSSDASGSSASSGDSSTGQYPSSDTSAATQKPRGKKHKKCRKHKY